MRNPRRTYWRWNVRDAHESIQDDVRWLIEHQDEIRRVGGHSRRGSNTPILVTTRGKCRIEFVGTYDSPAAARRHWEHRLLALEGGVA